MSNSWQEERRKVWGMLLDLKRQVKSLEKLLSKENIKTDTPEQPAKRAGA